MLSIPTSMAYTPNEIITKIKPYMTATYAVNPKNPLVTSQNMNGAVYIYKLPVTPAVFVFSSSGAIDCDGGTTAICKADTQGQSDTSFHTSSGAPLNAATLPLYVLPETPNAIFDYAKNNIQGGETGIIIYNDKTTYTIFGDERGSDHNGGHDIGEMSYGACIALGQSPVTCDPNTGGIDNGVTYIVFTTSSNVASPIESTVSAQTKGSSALNLMMNQLGSSPTPIPKPTPKPTPVLKSITVLPSSATVNMKGTYTISATAKDSNGNPMQGITILWSSSNTNVGTVSPLNVKTGSNGQATTKFSARSQRGTITTSAKSGSVYGSAKVTVR